MKNIRVVRNITRSLASFAKRSSLGLAAAIAVFTLTGTVKAQLGTLDYSQDFDTDSTANWVTFTNGYTAILNAGGDSLSYADFFFDYSTVGIPAAPNSVGGTTRGLKMGANLGPVSSGTLRPASAPYFPAGISVCPLGYGIANNFEMHFDMWMNYNKSGTGTTVVGGAGYGTAATGCEDAGASVDCVLIGATLDGGSSADFRVYGSAHTSSYQDADYVITGNTNSPHVYPPASRNNTAAYYSTNFPGGVPCPVAQTNLFPRQTGLTNLPGTLGFKWHDVSLSKVGRTITFKVDGILCATANQDDAGVQGGTNILFNIFDTNGGENNDTDGTNVCFVLIDNVRITNFPSVVTVQATTPNTSEATPGAPAVFTITRSQNNGLPMTVHYSLSGTAANGVQYQTILTSVTLAATDSSTNIFITPIEDGIANLQTTVTLTILSDPNYIGAGFDTVFIADNDTPTVDVSTARGQAYDRYDINTVNPDFILYHLSRRGATTNDLSVNLSYSGTAVGGTDFMTTNGIDVPIGSQGVDFMVRPIHNPAVTGNRTVIVGVAAGTGYAVGNGPATGTVVDSDYAAAPVLLSDALTDPNDATNWSVVYGTGDPTNNSANFNVDFGFTLTGAYGAPVPPPPGGAGFALHETCNKNVSPGAAGAVNAYYTNLLLSGNYAVRFSMNLIEGETVASATEGAVFGINHTGSQSNWWYGSGTIATNTWGSDGVWYFISAQALGNTAGDYQEFTGLGGTNGNGGWTRLATQAPTSFTDVFKDTPGPFTTIDNNNGFSSGMPANAPPIAYDASTWADVEIKQIGNVDTLSINHTVIFTYTNTTVWTSGYLMLGYTDPYGASIGSPDASVYYANLQVVQLPVVTTVTINNITISGGNVVIKFTTSNPSDTTSSFTLQSSGAVSGTYNNVIPAAGITSLGSNQFQATTPYNGGTQFYRIEHN